MCDSHFLQAGFDDIGLRESYATPQFLQLNFWLLVTHFFRITKIVSECRQWNCLSRRIDLDNKLTFSFCYASPQPAAESSLQVCMGAPQHMSGSLQQYSLCDQLCEWSFRTRGPEEREQAPGLVKSRLALVDHFRHLLL